MEPDPRGRAEYLSDQMRRSDLPPGALEYLQGEVGRAEASCTRRKYVRVDRGLVAEAKARIPVPSLAVLAVPDREPPSKGATLEERMERLRQDIEDLDSYRVGQLGAYLGSAPVTACITVDAAREVAESALGPRSEGALLCRRCDSPGCAAADHLFWGTPRDARRDAWLRGRRGSKDTEGWTPEQRLGRRRDRLLAELGALEARARASVPSWEVPE